jgi:hypothetical protein
MTPVNDNGAIIANFAISKKKNLADFCELDRSPVNRLHGPEM